MVPLHATSLPPEIYSHMWTRCARELRDDVPDNNGISKWKRLTNSLNVITPGVDLILWALVLLSHWSVPFSHLSVWCQICLTLSQLCRQNEAHYNWCISSWKEKVDPFTKRHQERFCFLALTIVSSPQRNLSHFLIFREMTYKYSVLISSQIIIFWLY